MAARAHEVDASSISIPPTARSPQAGRESERCSSFDAMGDGVTFLTPPLAHETEITGPSAVKLFVSSSTTDADLFVVLRVFSPDLKEVVFQGAIDPHTPIAQGWLRASHRKLDKKLSRPYRPYHTHTKNSSSSRARWWSSISRSGRPRSSCRPGYRVALSIRGRDYEYAGASGGTAVEFQKRAKRLRAVPAR